MTYKTIKIGSKNIKTFCFKLGKKNLIALVGKKGYIMCGYLDISLSNKLNEAAVKIKGVSNISQALNAKVCSCTFKAKGLGIRKNQIIKDILKVLS
jgi:uncharacterized protein YunC (DUF1805 family)